MAGRWERSEGQKLRHSDARKTLEDQRLVGARLAQFQIRLNPL